jgi:hypothetical protein
VAGKIGVHVGLWVYRPAACLVFQEPEKRCNKVGQDAIDIQSNHHATNLSESTATVNRHVLVCHVLVNNELNVLTKIFEEYCAAD